MSKQEHKNTVWIDSQGRRDVPQDPANIDQPVVRATDRLVKVSTQVARGLKRAGIVVLDLFDDSGSNGNRGI